MKMSYNPGYSKELIPTCSFVPPAIGFREPSESLLEAMDPLMQAWGQKRRESWYRKTQFHEESVLKGFGKTEERLKGILGREHSLDQERLQGMGYLGNAEVRSMKTELFNKHAFSILQMERLRDTCMFYLYLLLIGLGGQNWIWSKARSIEETQKVPTESQQPRVESQPVST